MVPRDHPVIVGKRYIGHLWCQAVRRRPRDALQLRTPVVADVAGNAALERRQAREWTVRMAAQHVTRRFGRARDGHRIGRKERIPAQRALRRAIEKEEVGKSAEADAAAKRVGRRTSGRTSVTIPRTSSSSHAARSYRVAGATAPSAR